MSRLAERLESRRLFAITVFTIDPSLSAITLSGSAAGFDLERQAEDAARETGDALERTGEAIKEGARDAARETGEALDRAGDEIRDAAK